MEHCCDGTVVLGTAFAASHSLTCFVGGISCHEHYLCESLWDWPHSLKLGDKGDAGFVDGGCRKINHVLVGSVGGAMHAMLRLRTRRAICDENLQNHNSIGSSSSDSKVCVI